MMQRKKQEQRGFTLIELVIVIVIIGILAAVAIPKFVALSDDARQGVSFGIGAAGAAASSTNYAAWKGGLSGKYTLVTTCEGLSALIQKPDDYGITGVTTGGSTGVCTAGYGTNAGSNTASFIAFFTQ